MLPFKKFNRINVIKTYRTIIKWYFFVLYVYYISSYKLITDSKRFNLTKKMCHRKSEFWTQILILLKPLLIHVHLRNDAMVI